MKIMIIIYLTRLTRGEEEERNGTAHRKDFQYPEMLDQRRKGNADNRFF